LYALLISPIQASCPTHLILLDLITLIVFTGAYKLWRSSLCSVLQPHTTPSLFRTLYESSCSRWDMHHEFSTLT
jgi:hypothetical protein